MAKSLSLRYEGVAHPDSCREIEPSLGVFCPYERERENISGSSSVGRASAFQAECRRFEPGLPLHKVSPMPEFLSIDRSRAYLIIITKLTPEVPSRGQLYLRKFLPRGETKKGVSFKKR